MNLVEYSLSHVSVLVWGIDLGLTTKDSNRVRYTDTVTLSEFFRFLHELWLFSFSLVRLLTLKDSYIRNILPSSASFIDVGVYWNWSNFKGTVFLSFLLLGRILCVCKFFFLGWNWLEFSCSKGVDASLLYFLWGFACVALYYYVCLINLIVSIIILWVSSFAASLSSSFAWPTR